MKHLILILLSLFSLQISNAQEYKRLIDLLNAQEYDNAVNLFHSDTYKHFSDANSCNIIGRVFYALHDMDSCIYYSERAIQLDHDATYVSAWSHVYLGFAYFAQDWKDVCKKELQQAIKMHATDNSTMTAKGFLAMTNSIPYFDSWAVIESPGIRYHIQDTSFIENNRRYIELHDRAFKILSNNFEPDLKKKIDFYVWANNDSAVAILGKELGFSFAEAAVVNVRPDQTVGHEMMHVLAYWAWGKPVISKTRLINEGLGVCFDMSMPERDFYKEARAAIKQYRPHIHSILDFWGVLGDEVDEALYYPIAGAWVYYLFINSTQEQFSQIVKQQDIATAQMVYGDKFEKMVNAFDNIAGLKH